jgi:hypothetical protein
MNKEYFIKQLDDIISDYNKIKSKSKYSDLSGNTSIDEILCVLIRAKTAIARIVGENSVYYKDAEAFFKQTNIYEGSKLVRIVGIVLALKSDLQKDYLKSLSDIIQSEVFSDYLEMAEYLLNEGYKDPAAVLIGSTLEIHLRELCISNNIDIEIINNKGNKIPKKAELMNADLAKNDVYTSIYQKQITAWLDLRNKAAHGKYSEYTKEEVSLMLQGVRQFIIKTK